jgi:hypothetical protein
LKYETPKKLSLAHKLHHHMKRIILLAAVAAPLLWMSCNNAPTEATPEVIPAGMTVADLTAQGFAVKINIPDSTKGVAQITEAPSGVQVRIGNNFDIIINVAVGEDADLKARKALITATDAGVSTFSTENDSTLIWETKFGEEHVASHFCVIRKIGTDAYLIHDNSDNPDNQFKKEAIDKMIESARSLRAKPVEAPKS